MISHCMSDPAAALTRRSATARSGAGSRTEVSCSLRSRSDLTRRKAVGLLPDRPERPLEPLEIIWLVEPLVVRGARLG